LLRDFVSICNGVEFAHSRNVLHRDLKPANVMVGRFGEVLVMDWGLTKLLASIAPEGPSTDWSIRTDRSGGPDGQSQPGVRGTPAYMPPEQANGSDRLDTRCDVFALGVILCQILTGRPAYTSDNPDPRARTKELVDLASRCATAKAFARLDARREPRELIELAKRCMSFAPGDRPATAKDVGDAVTNYQAGIQRRVHEAEVGRARAEAAAHAERRRRRWQLGLAGHQCRFGRHVVPIRSGTARDCRTDCRPEPPNGNRPCD
jgi:serine/threonine-protein kinase